MTTGTKILIVEDKAVTAEELSAMLTNFGYDVVGTTGNAVDAITKAIELNPDVVLIDPIIGGKSIGIDTAINIKKRKSQAFVFISALTDSSLLEKVKNVEPYGYLVSPFEDIQLFATIETALHKVVIDKALKDRSVRLEKLVKRRTKSLEDAQEQLVRKERLAILGQLTGSIGHELRDPLGTIVNAVYYLQSVVKDGGKIKEYLGVIETEVQRAENIVTDLLSFSRLSVADRENVSVSSVVSWALDKRSTVKGLDVLVDVDPDLKVFIDMEHLERVLNNLIGNACQSMKNGGTLNVSAYEKNGNVVLTVADTGKGISKRDIKLIFEPLYTTKLKGIGLGLTITKNLVEVNGGSIRVKSKLGKGSEFIVTLPAGKKENVK